MTCTIGFVDGSIVIIASDSSACCESMYTIRRGLTKVWRNSGPMNSGPFNGLIFGFAGDFSVCQWIRYVFEWPRLKPFDEDSFHGYLVKASQQIDEGLKKRFAVVEDWQLMIGSPETKLKKASLYVMYANGDVECSAEAYAAIGSGAACALGSLYATKNDQNKNSWDQIQIALEAAAANDVYIRKPWQVLHT